MKLVRLSHNAHALETSTGALLFSYERLTAVRQGGAVFLPVAAPLTVASRAHVVRFAGVDRWSLTGACDFAERCREVMAAGE